MKIKRTFKFATLGMAILTIALAATVVSYSTVGPKQESIYVDNLIIKDITNGSYSVLNRNNKGKIAGLRATGKTIGTAITKVIEDLSGSEMSIKGIRRIVADINNGIGSTNGKNCYRTIHGALSAMKGGDHILIRGGIYREGSITIPSSKNGTSWENYSAISAYNNERVVIDAGSNNTSNIFAIGNDDDASPIRYWKFEGLEITGGGMSGISFRKGPIIVRYCYIHDNYTGSSGELEGSNPAGIRGAWWQDSIIEYCYFKDNGSLANNGQHSVIGAQCYSDYDYINYRDIHPKDPDRCIKNNTIRYNLFENTKNRAFSGIHHKGQQLLASHPIPYEKDFGALRGHPHRSWGDKIHHNIFLGIPRSIGCQQDFAQVFNNIIVDSNVGIEISDYETRTGSTAVTVYNNTIIGGRILVNFGHPSREYVLNPYIILMNNIIDDSPQDYDRNYNLRIGDGYVAKSFNYDRRRVMITNNYVYRYDNEHDIGVPSENPGEGRLLMTIDEYGRGNRKNENSPREVNYRKLSSENIDPLYQGSIGTSKFKVRGGHRITDSISISEISVSRDHPYLEDVELPRYIGATGLTKDSGERWDPENPDPGDAGWVDYVWYVVGRKLKPPQNVRIH
ncbi:MAG: hypothetical protein PHY29_02565 [Syntrophales bacterium]|nr:hypothetical protein [Syntrophales bacterium]